MQKLSIKEQRVDRLLCKQENKISAQPRQSTPQTGMINTAGSGVPEKSDRCRLVVSILSSY